MTDRAHSVPHELPDPYVLMIGRIAVAGAMLEQRLHNIFSLLASEHPPTASGARRHNTAISVLLADDSLSQRIDRLRLLAERQMMVNGQRLTGAINRVVADDLAASLSGLVKRCEKARSTRNEYVHATWEVDRRHGPAAEDAEPIGGVYCTTTRARRLKTHRRLVTIEDLHQAAHEVEDAVSAAGSFHYDALSGKIHDNWGVMPGLD